MSYNKMVEDAEIFQVLEESTDSEVTIFSSEEDEDGNEPTCTHCTGGCVDPRAGLDASGKSCLTGFRSPDHPGRSRYID
jgi:hypothetical protein